MGKEVSLQYDLFTGELVDARSTKDKRRDKQHHQSYQTEMFSQRDLAQFGVRAKPQLPLSPKTRLELEAFDPRTDDEKEYDQMRAAEAQTYTYLGRQTLHLPSLTKRFPSGLRFPLVELEEQEMGFAVQITEKVNVVFWSTRDEEYDRLKSEFHLAGNEVYMIGDNELEILSIETKNLFRIFYSDMEMVENVEVILNCLDEV